MGAMLKFSLVLSLLGFLVIAVMTPSANALRKSVVLGGKSDVANVKNNREIQDLGRYCVEKFNQREESVEGNVESIAKTDTGMSDPLKFSRVVSAQKQVVAGTKYYLRIEVTQANGSTRMFDSVVVIQPWLHSKQLLGFTPVVSPIY